MSSPDDFDAVRNDPDPIRRGRRATALLSIYQQRATELARLRREAIEEAHRAQDAGVDLYVLGDSPIHYGTDNATSVFTDDRLAAVAPAERAHYVARLRAGHGFNNQHRTALIALQRVQRGARNTPEGFWIAEADPEAARHAVEITVPADHIDWAVLATDGAADYIDHTRQSWPRIARYDSQRLAALLDSADRWEAETDPGGHELPRAKRHDDKTIAAVSTLW